MTVFQQVLWMFVNIRVLGKQPRMPLPRESLIQYAVALELQYSRIGMKDLAIRVGYGGNVDHSREASSAREGARQNW